MSELDDERAELASDEGDGEISPMGDDTSEPSPDDPSFERLLVLLKETRAFDFTGYKRPSLMRRVRHRMDEIGVASFDDYADVLQLQPAEFTALFNTILINVTSFFRDPDAWGYLRDDVLPGLAAADGSIRVWSAGSSAGQEAYSIAMLLHDLLGKEFRDRVKIYATDVDEEALNHARQASYTDRDLIGLPQAFRERYFDPSDGRHVITPELRRGVIFGRNDLTRDAPISRIDVLLCRNTLMYFNAETQARIVHRLGFALRPEGVLFLGKAEMLLNHSAMFEPLDLKRRFFRRLRAGIREGSGMGASVREVAPLLDDGASRLRNQLLLTNPVAQIAVGADGRLAMVNYRAAAMLGISDRDLGRPFQDLEVSYRPVELRSHLAHAIETRAPVWLREVEWRRGSDPVYLDIQIVPLLEVGGQLASASFSFVDVTRFRQLRVEVEEANRQLEVAYEELQSTNEELETTNEELQSTNEELETMNEELQSANDEMQTTNEQLRDRTSEFGALNAFMLAVLSSFEGAVIVVDADLVVQVWTPQSFELWGLRADEAVGQRLPTLDSGLPTSRLDPWLRSVISGQQKAVIGQPVEAVNRLGRPVRLRVSVTPLTSGTDSVGGALIVMEDADIDARQEGSSSATG